MALGFRSKRRKGRRQDQHQSSRRWSMRRRPLFELLEDRRLLAAISWDGGGTTDLWSDRFNWSTDQVPGPEDDVTLDVADEVTVRIRGQQSEIRSLVDRESLILEGRTNTGLASLVVTSDLTNFGTIRMEATSNDGFDRGVYLTVSEGTLTNAATGVIDVRTGQGDPRRITGSITNLGRLLVESGTTLTVNGDNQSFQQVSGELRADGQFFSMLGRSISWAASFLGWYGCVLQTFLLPRP